MNTTHDISKYFYSEVLNTTSEFIFMASRILVARAHPLNTPPLYEPTLAEGMATELHNLDKQIDNLIALRDVITTHIEKAMESDPHLETKTILPCTKQKSTTSQKRVS